MNPHQQVPVKVKAFVDKGIAQLVTILNEFDGVMTFSSCEGRFGRWREDAHIYLYYGEPFNEDYLATSHFAAKLAKVLAQNKAYDVEVRLEWTGDKDAPFVSIMIPAEQVELVFRILSDHRSEFSYDI